MGPLVVRHGFTQRTVEYGGRGGDAEDAFGLALTVGEDPPQGVEALDDGTGEIGEQFPISGQVQFLPARHDEGDAILLLERAHLPPHRRRRHAELPRGLGEAAAARRLDQRTDLAKTDFLEIVSLLRDGGTRFRFHYL